MSTLDLYEEGFPHGSEAGYQRGCHGKTQCTMFGDEWWYTCVEAHQYRASDYAAGRLPVDQVIARPLAPEVKRSKPRSQRETFTEPIATSDTTEATSGDTKLPVPDMSEPSLDIAPAERPKPEKIGPESPLFPHWTPNGYNRGCKTIEDCPKHAVGEQSCTEALREYNRNYYGKKREEKRTGHPANHSFQGKPKKTTKPSAEVSTTPAIQSDDPVVDTAPSAEPDQDLRSLAEPNDVAVRSEQLRSEQLRSELALAEQAGRELQTELNRQRALLDSTLQSLSTASEKNDGLERVKASLAKQIHELEELRQADQAVLAAQAEEIARLTAELDIYRLEPVTAEIPGPTGPELTGGAIHVSPGVTITIHVGNK